MSGLDFLVKMFEDKAGPHSTVESYNADFRHVEVAIRNEDGQIINIQRYHLSSL